MDVSKFYIDLQDDFKFKEVSLVDVYISYHPSGIMCMSTLCNAMDVELNRPRQSAGMSIM